MNQSLVARGYLRDLAGKMGRAQKAGRSLSEADLLEAADRLRDIEIRWDDLFYQPRPTLLADCCCSHSLPQHEPDGTCLDCWCSEFIGAGSREAMTMLALRGALKDTKIMRIKLVHK